jgi:peptidoglycan/LPS O-acetylase OafA/YrhL
MKLAQGLLSPKSGNLDHLRLLAAATVIISHAWPLALGRGTAEPLEALTGHSLGGWAVALFFFLSGVLISTSAERRTPMAFWQARAKRIVPGLLVALLVTTLLAKLGGSTASLTEELRYVLRGVTLVSLEHNLSGAFADNPYPLAVNGPLWSLAHEVLAYGVCQAVVLTGLLRHRFGTLVLVGAALAFWAIGPVLPARLAAFAPLWLAFSFGMVAARYGAWLKLSPARVLLLILLAPMGWPFAVLAVGYGALTITLALPKLPRFGDWSFGLYIYGWPVAQLVVHLSPGMSPTTLALTSLAATLPFAALSWILIEKPALSLKLPGHKAALA